jgi:hypothetical protein
VTEVTLGGQNPATRMLRVGSRLQRLASRPARRDKLQNPVRLHGLRRKLQARRARQDLLPEIRSRGVPRDQQNLAVGEMFAHVVGQLDATHGAHHDVRNHGMRADARGHFDGGFRAVRGGGFVPAGGENSRHAVGDPDVVVHDKNAQTLGFF